MSYNRRVPYRTNLRYSQRTVNTLWANRNNSNIVAAESGRVIRKKQFIGEQPYNFKVNDIPRMKEWLRYMGEWPSIEPPIEEEEEESDPPDDEEEENPENPTDPEDFISSIYVELQNSSYSTGLGFNYDQMQHRFVYPPMVTKIEDIEFSKFQVPARMSHIVTIIMWQDGPVSEDVPYFYKVVCLVFDKIENTQDISTSGYPSFLAFDLKQLNLFEPPFYVSFSFRDTGDVPDTTALLSCTVFTEKDRSIARDTQFLPETVIPESIYDYSVPPRSPLIYNYKKYFFAFNNQQYPLTFPNYSIQPLQ